MKPFVVMILAALILPGSLEAQNAPHSEGGAGSVLMTGPTGAETVAITVHPACPVAMQAKQGSGAGLVAVRRQAGEPDNGRSILDNKPGQQIHLILGKVPSSQLDFEQVARATVTARGLSARSRIDRTPADLGSSPSDLRRTLDVTFGRESDGTLYADLDLPGFTSVQSIRIDSIVLKDGSKWSFDAGQRCTVTPDPLMLIAAH